jgi:hypothetical protein
VFDEKHTREMDAGNPFSEKMAYEKKKNPIIFKGNQMKGVSFTRAKYCLLSSFKTESFKSPVNDEVFLDGVNELADYIRHAGVLSRSIKEVVYLIVNEEGISEKIQEYVENEKIWEIAKPSTAVKPYHIHHSANNGVGGGDYASIIQRMGFGGYRGFLGVPASWMKKKDGRNFAMFYPTDAMDYFFHSNCTEPDIMCMQAWDAVRTLDAVRDELLDVYRELVMWTLLPCAMSSHRRLGQESNLGKVGSDVFKMIMGYVILNVE